MSNTANLPRFQQAQRAFTAHLRDPKRYPIPTEVEERRMAVYRELFYNNIQSLLASTYPVLNQVLPKEQWQALISDYFAEHKATTPLFPQMPQEFLRYLESERGEHAEDPPFLYELAHYEWAELAVSIDNREIDLSNINRTGDLLKGCPVLSPLAWPLTYQFPVHQISLDYQPKEPPNEPTYIVVYRALDDTVGFVHLNTVSAYLLQQLSESENRTGQQLLEAIATKLDHPNPQIVIAGGLEIMQEWRKREILLGVL